MHQTTHAAFSRLSVSYYAHASTHGRHKKTGQLIARIPRGVVPGFLLVITSLVERRDGDRETDSVVSLAHGSLSGFQGRAKLRDLRHVRRVHAEAGTRADCAVQLRADTRDDRSRVGPGGGESEHARGAGLHGLVGRGDVADHKRGPFRVQIGVGVADIGQSRSDIAEGDRGGIGGIGGEKNVHCCVLSRRAGLSALNCYKYIKLSGEVNTFLVKSLQSVCQSPGGVVGGCLRAAHVLIIPH